MATEEERAWTWFPDVVVASILSHLITPQDFVRFSAVCKQWRSLAKDQKRHHIATTTTDNQVPFLLLNITSPPPTSIDQWRLYNATQSKLLDFKPQIPGHVTKTLRGGSHGWFAYTEYCRLALFNPFTRAHVPINARIGRSSGFLRAILSGDPDADYFAVAARLRNSWQGTLALIRPGRDKNWKIHSVSGLHSIEEHDEWFSGDVMFDKRREWVYTIGIGGMLVRANVNAGVLETLVQPWNYNSDKDAVRNYLVETTSNRDLLMISRFVGGVVKVFKLQEDLRSFVKVDDLSGDAVFIGENCSAMAVVARDFEGIEADCIYSSWGVEGRVVKINVKDKRQWSTGLSTSVLDFSYHIFVIFFDELGLERAGQLQSFADVSKWVLTADSSLNWVWIEA
ncbi:hypothetical protein LINPERHAP1_LOCUS23609 [Linum perenne]